MVAPTETLPRSKESCAVVPRWPGGTLILRVIVSGGGVWGIVAGCVGWMLLVYIHVLGARVVAG